MGYRRHGFDELEGVSPSFVEALYRQYRDDPVGCRCKLAGYFDGLEADRRRPELGAGPNWPPTDDRRADRRRSTRRRWQVAATKAATRKQAPAAAARCADCRRPSSSAR